MNQESASAKPLTDWLQMEEGLRYRWVLLPEEEVKTLRENIQRRRENTQPSSGKQGKCAVSK